MLKKILIVDDDLTMLRMTEVFLANHGYSIATATNGDEGIAKAAEFSPDLIVLDVQMPRMNGYTFIFELKKIAQVKNVPIIILTAKTGMAEIFKVEGVKEYLTKPLQPEVLLTSIKKYV